MSRLITGARELLGIETREERAIWSSREALLRDTVTVNYYDKTFQAQLKREMDLIKAKVPDVTYDTLNICAEERLRLRALCAARCALPSSGVEVSQLQEMGFQTGLRERSFGLLRVVGFPEGWSMDPVAAEPSLAETSHATVTDESGIPQLNVFYRNSVAGDSFKGHTTVIA